MEHKGPFFVQLTKVGAGPGNFDYRIAGIHETKAKALSGAWVGDRDYFDRPYPVRRADPDLARSIKSGQIGKGDIVRHECFVPGAERFLYSKRAQDLLTKPGLAREDRIAMVRLVYEAAEREGRADETAEDVVPPAMPTYLRLVRDGMPAGSCSTFRIAGIYERAKEARAAADAAAGDIVREPDATVAEKIKDGTYGRGSIVEVLDFGFTEALAHQPTRASGLERMGGTNKRGPVVLGNQEAEPQEVSEGVDLDDYPDDGGPCP